ncbi:MAG: copper amine oxidase N-terminal domain-containing protein [Bacillota bacterium]
MISSRLKIAVVASIFLVFVFPLIFVKEAMAQTSTYVLQVPTLQSDSVGQLGTLYISEASYPMSLKEGDSVSINLPPCIELQEFIIREESLVKKYPTVSLDKTNRKFTVDGSVYGYGDFTQPIMSTDGKYGFSIQVTDNNRFNIKIEKGSYSSGYKFYFVFDKVYVKPLGPDDPTTITATVDAPFGSGFSTGTYTVANIALGGTTAVVDAPLSTGQDQRPLVPVLGEDGGKVASIIIKESAPGSLRADGSDVKLALSPGFTWNNVNIAADWGYNSGDVSYSIENRSDTSGRSVVKLIINKVTSSKAGRIIVTGMIDVDTAVAQPGDVQVSYEGTNPGVDMAVLTVAQYATSAKTAEQKTISDVTAGRYDQRIGQFSVQEETPGDLTEGRTVAFTLPSCAKWHTVPYVVREQGDGELEFLSLNSDKDTIRYKVKKASTVRSVFIFKNGSVDLALATPDTLSVTVSGTLGITGSIDIGNVMQPVTLQAGKGAFGAGMLGQAIGDISVSEQRVGALRALDISGNQAQLTMKLPSGVRFAGTPEVTVVDGDLSLDKTAIRVESGNKLVIPVQKSGTAPSTIKITGIKLNVDRTVPEGDIKMEVEGTAITETNAIFADSNNKIDLVVASCNTPASKTVSSTAVFKIDKSSYIVNGRDVPMDVAPYIKDGRTMIPLRFAANAVGVANDNIIWDAGANMVTLVKGNCVAQAEIGNKNIRINGISVATDVAPEIKDGRTMVPIRALSTVLGAKVQWNESDQTVTVNVD